jgi:hypothetical protein
MPFWESIKKHQNLCLIGYGKTISAKASNFNVLGQRDFIFIQPLLSLYQFF